MATRANTTGSSKGTRRSSQGNKATDDEMLTDVKEEKDFVLDEDKITREEFERAMSSRDFSRISN